MNNSELDLEAQVLGASINNPGFYDQIAYLDPAVFSDPAHLAVWNALRLTKDSGAKICPATVLLTAGKELAPFGGAQLVSRLASFGDDIVTSVREAADRLHQQGQWRKISNIAQRLTAACATREANPDQVLAYLIQMAKDQIDKGKNSARLKSEVAREALARAIEPRTLVITGINDLDYLMQGGLQSRRLYGVGGVYGTGKTILLSSISENLNFQDIPHLMVMLETEPADIEIRACARHMKLNAAQIFDQNDPDHATFVESVENYFPMIKDNTFYEFCPGASMDEIHRLVLRAKSRNGIKGFMIDYWQLIQGRDRTKSIDAHLSSCADRIAAICRQEDLWCIMTVQIDHNGIPKYSDGILTAASLYIRMVREPNDHAVHFTISKSNYTRYAETGRAALSGVIFDESVGPHFKNITAFDAGLVAQAAQDDLAI